MTLSISPKNMGKAALLFAVSASAIYLLMIQITLPRLQFISGQIPFDMRPMGYSPVEAREILSSLGESGRSYYLTHQIPLDTIYPALMALTLITLISWLNAKRPMPHLAGTGKTLAVVAAIADYLENLGIVVMLKSWPNVPDVFVNASSLASITKAMCTTGSALIAMCFVALWMTRRFRPARA